MSAYHSRVVDVSSVHHSGPAELGHLRWNEVLRGLRETRGVTQDGWAARLGYGRSTVHRWERGEAVPGPDAVEALVTLCKELGLLRRFERGRLRGLTLTAELLRELLAEARQGAAPEGPSGERSASEDLAEAQSAAIARAPEAPLIASPALRHNLPIPLSSFVGRATEMRSIVEMLRDARLVTLTGAGGCVKSRLALEIGRALAGEYPDGIWLVELAPLAEPDLVPHVVATTLGIAAAPGESLVATLVAALIPRRLLLLLDNCEHLVDAGARLAEAILRRCPTVRILATSREALGIAGEVRWQVPPLAVPPDDAPLPIADVTQYAAARLFVDRARAALPAFEPLEHEAGALSQICRRLDGIPLAIELAAALVATLPLVQIAARLDRRFQLLVGGGRTALHRHQTLEALVAWSYDLLDEAERCLFERLSVFAGAFSLEAVESVCDGDGAATDAVVPLLARLVGKSLVVAEPGAEGSGRYRLLETLRQFGWERLEADGTASSVGERHARYYLALAEEGERGLRGRDQVAWLRRLEADHDNLRAGLAWFERHGKIRQALRLAGALALFWAIRGYYAEGRAHIERLLRYEQAAECLAERAKAVWGLGTLAERQGDSGVLRTCFEESLASAIRAGDHATIIGALIGLARSVADEDVGRARNLLDEALDRVRALDDQSSVAAVYIVQAVLAAHEGQSVVARQRAEEAVALSREIGDLWRLGWALHFGGAIAFAWGDYATARAYFEEKLAVARALSDRSALVNILMFLGQVAVEEQASEVARARFTEGLGIYRDRGDRSGIASAASCLAELALAEGDLDGARAFADESLAASRGGSIGHRVTALLCRGDVALAEGDVAGARRHFVEGLTCLGPAWLAGPTAQMLQAMARVAVARNQPVRALRLAGWAGTKRGWKFLRPASIDRDLLERALARLRATPGAPPSDEQTAAWAEGEADDSGAGGWLRPGRRGELTPGWAGWTEDLRGAERHLHDAMTLSTRRLHEDTTGCPHRP